MLDDFLATVGEISSHQDWVELDKYLALVEELLDYPKLANFLVATRALSTAHEWQRLDKCLAITERLINRPRAVLTLGNPEDKPLK